MQGMPTADFPGIRRPSIDFQDVRDGRRSTPFYVDVDLSTARTIAAGTQLVLPIAGNSFYCDPAIDASGNPIGGVAIVHFQDTTLNPQGTPFTVAPQFIANVPFTQVLIENPAQLGKRLRIVYGVDIDFRPGINAQVSITGNVSTVNFGNAYGVGYASTVALAANTPQNVLAAASNTNGVRVVAAAAEGGNVAPSQSECVLIAKASAPANIADGDVLMMTHTRIFNAGALTLYSGRREQPLIVASGKRLDFIGTIAETINNTRSCLYTIL